jgi:hypothetical protein
VPRVEWTVEFTGSGLAKPTAFTYEQLSQMKLTRLDDVMMLKTHGPDQLTSWRGVSMDALLEATQLKPGSMSFVFEAPDGYKVKCSRRELKSAMLALQDGDGKWLAESDPTKPIRLVPPEKPGDYWMANPGRVIVEPAPDPG